MNWTRSRRGRTKTQSDSCGVKTNMMRLSMLLCGRNRPSVQDEALGGMDGRYAAFRDPPTQEIVLVRQDPRENGQEEQDSTRHAEEQHHQRDNLQDTQSVFSEVTLDARLISESVWDDLPHGLQEQLSWDKIVPPHVTPLETAEEHAAANLCCCICTRDDFKLHEMASINSCQHAFCFQCIDTWAAYENTCPLCKLSFQTITIKGQQPKFVPKRKQPSSNSIMAPFEARTMSSSSLNSADSEVDMLMAQVYASLDELSAPASVNAQDDEASDAIHQLRRSPTFDFS